MNKLHELQTLLKENNESAYVIVDYENKNELVKTLLGNKMLTRKIVLIVPSEGKGKILCHFIDSVFLKDENILEFFDLCIYKTWQELLDLEKKHLLIYKSILMDISNYGLLPRISLADFGSVDYIRSLGIQIKSSGDILQEMVATLSNKQKSLQDEACKITLQIKDEAFTFIKDQILKYGQTNEYEVQQFICKRFTEEGLIYDEAPIVAIGPNASNPHYGPTKDTYSIIKEGDLILIDMWAKHNDKDGVYADITWMGYVGKEIPQVYIDRFNIVKSARDGVIEFLTKEVPTRKVKAFESDDIAREIITKAGYGEYFSHRVGHNIGADVSPHGPGANLDNFETHDDRTLLNNTSFSDEPGIYAPDFGVRSETDLRIENNQLKVVGGLQNEIIAILAD